jgi:hypothetical protein
MRYGKRQFWKDLAEKAVAVLSAELEHHHRHRHHHRFASTAEGVRVEDAF